MFISKKKIITSNIKVAKENESEYIISFNNLVKCGWNHIDNSTLMLLRLLDKLEVGSIAIAGFDGYSFDGDIISNYASKELELSNVVDNPTELNKEIYSMLEDYNETRKSKITIKFITESRFAEIFE